MSIKETDHRVKQRKGHHATTEEKRQTTKHLLLGIYHGFGNVKNGSRRQADKVEIRCITKETVTVVEDMRVNILYRAKRIHAWYKGGS